MTAIENKHPLYVDRLGAWLQMQDTYAGEKAVKLKRTDYLPPTETMIQDGMVTPNAPGWKDYNAYLQRAVFHDYVRDAVKAMVGIMHMKPPIFKLPKRLEGMLKKATIQGETLQQLLRRVNEAQLVSGRCGLLVDAPTGVDVDKAMPYLAFYDPMHIINWDTGREDEGRNVLELVVLDESGYQREGFVWKNERKFRVLVRGLPDSLNSGWTRPDPDEPFHVAVKVNDLSSPVIGDFITPQIGGRTLDEIPFIFIGANDLVPEPDMPPLLGLSNLALAIYRAEADYRQTLFMQGQATLVIVGANASDTDTEIRTGNKGVIDLRVGGSADYIGVPASGLSEMRKSLMNDKNDAKSWGRGFLDLGNVSGESGEALRIRVAARSTTVTDVARVGGAGLEQALKYCAEWMGEDPDEVSVIPNTDFADQTVAGAALLAFMQAKQLGLPLALQSLHRMMRANDMTEMTYDEEQEAIEEESITLLGMLASGISQGPTGEDYLDDPTAGGDPAAPAAPANGPTVPITPHVRGTPAPAKAKVGHKGASANKKNQKVQK